MEGSSREAAVRRIETKASLGCLRLTSFMRYMISKIEGYRRIGASFGSSLGLGAHISTIYSLT